MFQRFGADMSKKRSPMVFLEIKLEWCNKDLGKGYAEEIVRDFSVYMFLLLRLRC